MTLRLIIVSLLAAVLLACFAALGTWQVHRLAWKLDLIERVDARIHADPVPAPAFDAPVARDADEYRRVSVTGSYLNDDEVLVYTPSDFGPAYWVLTPLQRADGSIVMINRGIVPQHNGDIADFDHIDGETTVTGLLRISEADGWLFSRESNPDEQLWYRRDIGSITQAKGFERAAPYFIDEELTANSWPRGGQTVVSFRNSHLSYAITWYALALMVIGGYGMLLWHEIRHKN
ncbi:SURF1 family protein [Salipiger sp. 1_MG-2023]|uniref:SURF1 family protein n=1 Tax=Salipiger sp. 1_MG-2023 TaxID=3062665 RepID=UPI0026E43B68|nr:SURF1 family protein [Salipiger sp. 1_MG-2023]MDO6584864.1 SURF1 family protein [Salipiger sp. 1_MG-2023]